MKKYINNFMKYRELLLELIRRDIKTKYRRSVLGMLWSVLNPLGMMVVLSVVFSNVFRANIENFPVYLMCGQLIFNFFNEATNVAMGSILGNASLIKKVYLPKYIFPTAKICSTFVNLMTSFIALLVVVVFTRTPIHPTIFLVIFPIIYVFLFALGFGIFLSAIVVVFRDMQHFYSILVTAWMYLTPIFYPIDILPNYLKIIVGLNPLANIIEMFREVVLYGAIPSVMLHVKCLVSCGIALVVGLYVFYKQQDKFILRV
ncbi:ABC-2 type transport system permease protein [Lachnospiraceae bacterium PFB1-21]